MKPMRKLVRPSMEILEDRLVPATFNFGNNVLNGTVYTAQAPNQPTTADLTISAQSGALTINVKAATTVATGATTGTTSVALQTVTVTDNKGTFTFIGVEDIIVVGTTNPDIIKFQQNNFAFTGNLTFNGGDGDDSVTVTGSAGKTVTGGVSVNGGIGNDTVTLSTLGATDNVKLLGGTGNDSVTLSGLNLDPPNVTLTQGASVPQVALTFDGGNGNDTFTVQFSTLVPVLVTEPGGKQVVQTTPLVIRTGLGNDSVTLTGLTVGGEANLVDAGGNDTVTFTNVVDVDLRTTINGFNTINIGNNAAANFDGAVTISPQATEALAINLNIDGSPGNAVTFQSLFNVIGTAQADTVIYGDNVFHNGLATFTMKAGNNSFQGGSAQFRTVTFTGTTGNDVLNLGTMIATGNAAFNLGEGTNTYDLTGQFNIAANLSITSGSGADNVGTVGGFVGSSLTFNLGAGGSAVSLAGTANVGDLAFFFTGAGTNTLDDNATTTIGGTVRINAAATAGSTSYTARRTGNYNLAMFLGSGNDTFTYAGGAAISLSGILSGDGGTNTFTAGTATTTNLRLFGFA